MRRIFRLLGAATLLAGLAACVGSNGDDGPPAFQVLNNQPVASTQKGLVAGTTSATSTDVYTFQGIPFAKPPVGSLRWRAPEDADPWPAVKQTTQFGPACMQVANISKSEDCLFVNVWTPKTAALTGQNLPVMVWVFGGSFDAGSGNIDGTELAKKGVVVVSMNYRVGTFGFLAHPQLSAESADKVSGNYGLLDVAKSLKWVQQNIQNMGGDPGNITIWGVSAGASTITALMSSPRSKGLFQKVILESPGAFRHWQSLPQAEQQGAAVGADINKLRALPTASVPLITNTAGTATIRSLSTPRVIGPTQDGVILPHEERPTFEAKEQPIVPTLLGNNFDEGTIFTRAYKVGTVDDYKGYLASPQVFGSFGTEALAIYPASNSAEILAGIALSFGDSQFWFGTRGIARAQTSAGAPVFRYYFTRKGQGGAVNALHGDEVAYVFGDAKLSRAPYTADDVILSATIIDAWTRFATTGNPNGGAIRDWPLYDNTSERTYVLDVQRSIVNNPRGTQLDFIARFDSSIPAK